MAAGMNVSWGYDNKTMALRVVANAANSFRVEHRVPGSDANVYLVFAALLAGGLYGIENELELPAPAVGDAYATRDLQSLPRNLSDALVGFESSAVAAEYLGEEFVRRYAGTRRWEIEQYELEVTDWERRRYFLRP
jgi:glutamine synthetase